MTIYQFIFLVIIPEFILILLCPRFIMFCEHGVCKIRNVDNKNKTHAILNSKAFAQQSNVTQLQLRIALLLSTKSSVYLQ